MNANHCRTKVDILLEISGLKFFIHNSDEIKYLHFMMYSSERLTMQRDEDDVQAQVKKMSGRLEGLEEAVADINEHLLDVKS